MNSIPNQSPEPTPINREQAIGCNRHASAVAQLATLFLNVRRIAVELSHLQAFQQRVVKPHLVAVFNHFQSTFGNGAQQVG
jgi:hypothetical protein